ncbi:MAG: glycosyl transferase, family 2 [Bryobacterales bacterium]|nr:glycosyl transferase, family 2 [Bryobacterales bacterium]
MLTLSLRQATRLHFLKYSDTAHVAVGWHPALLVRLFRVSLFLFWFFAGPALVLAIAALRGERKRSRFVAQCLAEDAAAYVPPASVVVPIKGPEEGLRENLAALASLDYPDYELIVSARTAADIPAGVLPARIIVVLGGANDAGASERIQNLTAGIRSSRKRSEIFAFADAAGRVSPKWLLALSAPLADGTVGASTGYRWYVPEPPDFWSLMRSVWNAPIAGLFGPGNNPFAWGGSMAIRKEAFFELRIPDCWRDAISDDGELSRAIHRAHRTIAFAPGAVVAMGGRPGAREFFKWAKRQLAIARVYCPRLWRSALIAHFFYCGGMAAAIIASIRGHRGAEWALVVQLGLGMLKGNNRATLAMAELPGYEAWFKRHAWVHSLWVPLATWIWLSLLRTSMFTRTVEWRASRYRLPRESRSSAPT